MTEIKKVSLRDSIIESIGNFLWKEGFERNEVICLGILEMVNLISDYHEEGNALYPEILVTNNLDFFKTIPNKEVVIKEAELTTSEFKNAIKLCAPLAINSWIIFIEVKNGKIKYGITNAEMSETSPSIYHQTVGRLKVAEYNDITIAYIRNIGQKNVELAGLKNRLFISLTLEEPKDIGSSEIQMLSKNIAQECDENYKINIETFFEKVIDDALKNGHGNLIGVVQDTPEVITELKERIPSKEGIYLITPIDFGTLIMESENSTDSEASTALKVHASILKSMLNHDGITIISNKGRIIGYHILIKDFVKEGDKVIGGARSKAFKSMENCEMFNFCFYKSQDGNVKIWQRK